MMTAHDDDFAALRLHILHQIGLWGRMKEADRQPFKPGETYIPPSGAVKGPEDYKMAADAVLDGWFTEGPWVAKFERALAKEVGARSASMVNSGSSANLLAISILRSKMVKAIVDIGDRDEIITSATGFPTTLNPILQNGFKAVLVDCYPGTYLPDPDEVLAALSDRTAAVFIAHTLGNPFPFDRIKQACRVLGVQMIEDNCDALGTLYKGRMTGTMGLAATQSFYPAHHITTGEGGALLTRHPAVRRAAESIRDWGRDCWCEPGKENTCGKRFDWAFPNMPAGYDHKYTYSNIGYNLKSTDLQAALGVTQLSKLPKFTMARRANFARLYDALSPYKGMLTLPEATEESEPSWFGFPISVRPQASFTRAEFVAYLTKAKIGTRNIMAGNLLRQPAYDSERLAGNLRAANGLGGSDEIMARSFWIGVWPGIEKPMLDYMIHKIVGFLASRS